MANEAEPPLLEMQARLAADAGGVERRKLEEAIATLRATLRRRMAAGASPDEFRRLEAVDAAAEAAEGVVSQAWRRYHGGT
jgi:hypothetical protein